jgi:ABC-type glycerol-3-phosphate transport system permease component
MKILQIIAGILLLLPGICSLGFILLLVPEMNSRNDNLWVLWLPCLAVGALGIWIIRNAKNRP